MIKDYRRYRNFMIVFEDDRYYVCPAKSFSKNGNNRYSFGEFETIDDAKKRIDKYYSDEGKEESRHMVKNYKAESCSKNSEELELLDGQEILNEEEDEDIPYPEKPNLLNLIDYYMDKYDMDEDNATECARGDLEAMGKYTRYFDESVKKRSEATNPSSIGQFKKSTIGSCEKKLRVNPKKKSAKNEDRIITKDDELNKTTNVQDGGDDDIEISVKSDPAPSVPNSSNNSNKEETEVILNEEASDFDKSNIILEQGSVISTKYGDITINRIYSHWDPFENRVETKADIELNKDGRKVGYDTMSVDKIFKYIE